MDQYTGNSEPGPIRLARWFSTLAAVGLSLGFLMAALNLGTFQYYGRSVTGPEFLALAGVPMGAFAFFFILLCLGLWLKQAWVRPFFLLSLTAGSLVGQIYHPGPPPYPNLSEALTGLVLVALSAWYLYGNAAARSYFNSMRRPTGQQ